MFPLCVIVIVASLVLGGGTRSGFLSDAILQLIAIPLLLVSLWRLLETPLTKQMRVALFFCVASIAIPLIQLIPLPPWLWTALPGREPAVEVFEILGDKLSWMPISLSPNATWLSALSLMPPIAIFLGTMLSTYRERRWLSLVFLAVGVVSVFLGFIQVAQGEKSPWRFFAYTNFEEAVGFFANKNHFAALLYALIMFAAAWMIHAAARMGEQRHGRRYDAGSILPMIGAFTLLVVLLAGEVMARSRMGLGLTMVALLGAVALAVSDRRVGSVATATRLIIGAVALVLIFSTQFALYRILARFGEDPLQDARMPFARTTLEAAIAYMPLGSGLGTSVPVYAMFEKPENALVDRIVNHHNDVLELWLGAGPVGLVLTGMFVVWLLLRSVEIWWKGPIRGASELDWTLARGATIVVALLVAQSLVDSPLRTAATMSILAFASALLIEPPLGAEKSVEQTSALKQKIKRLPQIPRPAPVATLAEQSSALTTKMTRLLQLPRLAPAETLATPKSTPVPKPTPPTVPMPPTPMPLSKPTPTTVPNPPTLSKPTPRTHDVDPFLDVMEEGLGHVRRALAGDTPERAGDVDVEPTPPTGPKPPTPMPLSKPAPASSEVGALSPDQRWGTDIDWPDEWSKSSKASSASSDDKPSGAKSPKGS